MLSCETGSDTDSIESIERILLLVRLRCPVIVLGHTKESLLSTTQTMPINLNVNRAGEALLRPSRLLIAIMLIIRSVCPFGTPL